MTDTNGGAAQPGQAQLRMQVLGQYIRDLSFENAVARRGVSSAEVQPDIELGVSVDPRKRQVANQYEIVTKFKVTCKNRANGETLFLAELEYGGIFHIEGIPDEQLHPFLSIECPRMLFPFVRRILIDTARDAGFTFLNIDTVDFLTVYRQQMQRVAEAQKAAAPAN